MVGDLVHTADAIFHLAAAVGVRTIVEQPLRSMQTNLHGTENVLEFAGKRPLLLTSTSEVYGKSAECDFAENSNSVIGSTTIPRWSYACAKMMDEFLALAYHRELGTPVTIARLFNVTGPRQTGRYGMVVPRFVHSALRGEPLTIYGSGHQTRCFAHVSDVVDALIKLLGAETAVGEVVNVGSDYEVSINQLAKRVCELLKSSSILEYHSIKKIYGDNFEDMHRRRPCLRKVRSLIKYRPQKTLDDIIHDVAAYPIRSSLC